MKREKKHKEVNSSLSSDCSEPSKDLDYPSYESPINATQAPLFKSTGQEKGRVMEEILKCTKDDYGEFWLHLLAFNKKLICLKNL